jgi:hypothetical protein
MSKSFEPRSLCSKIHSSPHSCISKFYAIFGNFSQIFLPPKSLYSICNPILIHKSIRIDFPLLYLISAREIVSARPPLFFSSKAVAHLLPPCPAQSARRLLRLFDSPVPCSACLIRPSLAPPVRFGRRLPLADRWAHPVSELRAVTFIGQCPSRHRPGRRCHIARRRPSPSRTWKELNRSAESPPSVSPLNRHCPVASRSPPRNSQPPLTPPPLKPVGRPFCSL